MSTLIVIGNGFDLHRGVPCRYTDFGEFVRAHDQDVFAKVEQYLPIDDFWHRFEEGLADFDSESALAEASQFLESYGAEDWSDAYHHNVQFEAQQIAEALSSRLKALFTQWIIGLPQPPNQAAGNRLSLPVGARYLTFNYTPTLELVYGIPASEILYLHGKVGGAHDLVLGHAVEPNAVSQLGPRYDNEEADTRMAQAASILDDYFRETFKPTDRVLRNNRHFFEALSDVRSIWVLGHSLADVDYPYFKAIHEASKGVEPDWRVSVFSEDDRHRATAVLDRLDVPTDRRHLFELAALEI